MATESGRKADDRPAGVDFVAAAVEEVRALIIGDDVALLRRFVGAQAARAERLDADRTRLTEELGSEHPRVQAITARLAQASALAARLGTAAEDQACVSDVGQRDWAVLGTITDDEGEPLAGLRVRLRSEDDSRGEGLKPVTTDALGRFRAVYQRADLKTGEKPAFGVLVENREGKVLFRSPESLTPLEGRFTSLSISLATGTVRNGGPKERCTARTAKGKRCRNVAAPGSPFCLRHRDSLDE